MSAGETISLEGGAQLAASLSAAASSLDPMPAADSEAATLVRTRAAQGAPRLSGTLANSITATFGDGVLVGTGVPYALFVEFGTARMSAQPFLRPALEASTEQVLAIYTAAVDRELANVKGA